ncbi:uncharacterized protein LOC110266940 [Arachis ipaensis]|uniref:uncharacterized protein LOC110266940 n=1 Tax=Arachis ipaensis TaxID=130454 RepID=UPI000A2B5FCB|nr:uncharacterized protein LOC110266940 [Arachis ipaensis]XP_025678914.1 uncharacterized protein LOC112778851 [Arachis hypogaea]
MTVQRHFVGFEKQWCAKDGEKTQLCGGDPAAMMQCPSNRRTAILLGGLATTALGSFISSDREGGGEILLNSFCSPANFFRILKIVGVGYKARAEDAGSQLFLKLGYSHELQLSVPPAVRGIDKGRVNHFAGTVRSIKPPDDYKGKGIMYVDEFIKRRKE